MTKFAPSVFLDNHPAQLRCGNWQWDEGFLKVLRASWLAQYSEYIGEEAASAYLAQLEREQRLFDHHDPLTVHACIDELIVGIGAVRPLGQLNLITLLEVHPQFQQQGIGRQMLQALYGVGPRTMAHVSIHRPSVRAFYQAQGFHVLQRDLVQHGPHMLPFDVLAR